MFVGVRLFYLSRNRQRRWHTKTKAKPIKEINNAVVSKTHQKAADNDRIKHTNTSRGVCIAVLGGSTGPLDHLCSMAPSTLVLARGGGKGK